MTTLAVIALRAARRRRTRLALCFLSGSLLCGVISEPAARAQAWWPPKPLPGYNIFSTQQEQWLGEVLVEEMQLDRELINDPQATAYLQKLGDRLVAQSKRADVKYSFFLYSDPTENAFALPGGRIYVHTGLIQFCENEAELAAVLGHEIAHVALRQSAKTVSRWFLWGPGIDSVSDKEDIRQKLARLEAHLRETNGFQRGADLFFGVARIDEVWADKYGVWNMNASGFDAAAAVSLFERMDRIDQSHRSNDPWERLLEILVSSHPPPKDRVNLLKMEIAWMKKDPKASRDSAEFQALKVRLASAE